MKITYIHHSSFCVELDSCILLFDYFKGIVPTLNSNKKLYVFASHQHHDHFDASIFNLESVYKDVTYILSDDISSSQSKNTVFIKPNQSISLDNLKISTLESTDLGVAFIVEVQGKRIYHAGDLNCWHWEGENTVKENEDAFTRYKKEIDKISKSNFDVAFVVLDPRQSLQYHIGFDLFMKSTNTDVVFPMHNWGDYDIIDKLKNEEFAKYYKDKVIKISHDNESFEIM